MDKEADMVDEPFGGSSTEVARLRSWGVRLLIVDTWWTKRTRLLLFLRVVSFFGANNCVRRHCAGVSDFFITEARSVKNICPSPVKYCEILEAAGAANRHAKHSLGVFE